MSDYIKFTILGEPVGKGRPKFSTVNGHAVAYTPKKTANYETLVKLAYQTAYPQCKPFDKGVQLRMQINAYFQIPKSANKKKTAQMECGEVRPTKKPDCDNVVKAVCDALNGIAYYDDSQITEMHIGKYYSCSPRCEVEIWRNGNADQYMGEG